jgi:hypothetical protein
MLQRLLLMIRLVRVLMMRGHDFPSYSYPITRCSLQPSMHLCRALILKKKIVNRTGSLLNGGGGGFRFVSLPRVKHKTSSRFLPRVTRFIDFACVVFAQSLFAFMYIWLAQCLH